MRVEHAFAALKGQFQSLREVCVKIWTEKDTKVAIFWVLCCIILHNMIVCFEGEIGENIMPSTDWAINKGSGLHDEDVVEVAEAVGTPGQQFHMGLLDKLFQHLGWERTHT